VVWSDDPKLAFSVPEPEKAIVAVADGAGFGLPTDEHLRADEICRELPRRSAAMQCCEGENHSSLICLTSTPDPPPDADRQIKCASYYTIN